MENDILDSLNDLGYQGPLNDEVAFAKALDGGPKSLEFTKLIHILAAELQTLCHLEEAVSIMNDPDESSAFLLELSSFLKELGCPYKCLVTGHMSSRLQSKQDRLLLLDYMISELMSARMVQVDAPKEKQAAGMEIVMQESPTAKDLKEILISLKFNKPPPNITAEMLFSKLEAKLKDTIQKEGDKLVGKPLYNKAISEKEWKNLETTYSEMYEEYRLRRETLITRLECTIQSFEWSDRLKTKKDLIQSVYRPKRDSLKVKPDVKLSDFLAARSSLLHVEKTSSASVRKNTQSEVNKVIIGQKKKPRKQKNTADQQSLKSESENKLNDGQIQIGTNACESMEPRINFPSLLNHSMILLTESQTQLKQSLTHTNELVIQINKSVIQPNDFAVEPNEFVVEPKKFVVEPNEFVVEQNEFVVEPNEFVVEPNEFIVEPNAKQPNESMAQLNQAAMLPIQPVIQLHKHVMQLNEDVLQPNEPAMQPNEHVIQPNEPVILPNEPVINLNDPIIQPNRSKVKSKKSDNPHKPTKKREKQLESAIEHLQNKYSLIPKMDLELLQKEYKIPDSNKSDEDYYLRRRKQIDLETKMKELINQQHLEGIICLPGKQPRSTKMAPYKKEQTHLRIKTGTSSENTVKKPDTTSISQVTDQQTYTSEKTAKKSSAKSQPVATSSSVPQTNTVASQYLKSTTNSDSLNQQTKRKGRKNQLSTSSEETTVNIKDIPRKCNPLDNTLHIVVLDKSKVHFDLYKYALVHTVIDIALQRYVLNPYRPADSDVPRFSKCARFKHGGLRLHPEDVFTVRWVRQTVQELGSLWRWSDGLEVIYETDVVKMRNNAHMKQNVYKKRPKC